jgi:hypothetical protein
MLTEADMSKFFDDLPDDQRDGMTKAQFMQVIKRIMDPKTNGRILNKMVEIRGREACARANKAAIDRASRNRKRRKSEKPRHYINSYTIMSLLAMRMQNYSDKDY